MTGMKTTPSTPSSTPGQAAKRDRSNTSSGSTAAAYPWKQRPGRSRWTRKDESGRSPVRQGFDYAVLSNLRWFLVTNGARMAALQDPTEGQPKSSQRLRAILPQRGAGKPQALSAVPGHAGPQRVRAGQGGHLPVGFAAAAVRRAGRRRLARDIYAKLVESRVRLYRAIHPQFADLPQEKINEAVVKLLFRIMFIRFAEDTPLLPSEFLSREIVEQFERDQKWGRNGPLYGYLQRYFAWLDGRDANSFGIYPYDGALFDPDPILDAPRLSIQDDLLKDIVKKLSHERVGRKIDYAQINPRILGNIYEKFLGYVIEIQEGRLDPQADRDTRRKEGSFYTPEPVTKSSSRIPWTARWRSIPSGNRGNSPAWTPRAAAVTFSSNA